MVSVKKKTIGINSELFYHPISSLMLNYEKEMSRVTTKPT
jgi:hypothetical protein